MRRLLPCATTTALAFVIALLGPSRSAAQGQNPAAGREIFRTRCAMCHGPEGRGDGPAAAAMNPRPTNLTVRAQLTAVSDSAVRAILTSGRRTMPPFAQTLTRAQLDSVVAYVRSLAH